MLIKRRRDEEQDENWERSLLEDLATEALKERRRNRRWGIVFKLLAFVYLAVLLAMWRWDPSDVVDKTAKEHTAVIDIEGLIAAGKPASAEKINKALGKAFKDEKTKGVILRINSPGGSPVQADYIYQEIVRLRKKHPKIKVYAVATDLCASAAYYIASAADEIHVNPASVVGSIGVLINAFGFEQAMNKLGVERRLLTAGRNKGILDPFSPLTDEQRAHIKRTLGSIHEEFISAVKKGRGDRLKENPDIFSGLFWDGREAVELGLADAMSTPDQVARDIIKAEEMVDFTEEPDLLTRLSKRFAGATGEALLQALSHGPTPSVELR